MFTELRVRNLALIEAAELEFKGGLTVLSGETGAGKTALLSSLKLLIGERGDSSMVGAAGVEARVEAAFTGGFQRDSAEDVLEEQTDVEQKQSSGSDRTQSVEAEAAQSTRPEVSEHLIVRRLTAEGRSRCYLDDSLVTVGKLNEVLGPCVDLYGQHEHQSLLKPREQLRILDEFGGPELKNVIMEYQQALYAYKEAECELQELLELSSSSGAEREQAAFVLREVEKIAPQVGEYEALEADLPRLQHGEQLMEASQRALEYLRDEGGALEQLAAASSELEGLKGIDQALDEPLEHIESLLIALEEVTGDISRYALGIEHDPEALQQALDRLGELDGLSRRFGPGMEQVFVLKEHSERLLQSTENNECLIVEAESKLKAAQKALESAAAQLAKAREKVSKDFIDSLNASISDLALEGASLEFIVQELPFEKWTASGSQSFELLYRPAPSATPQPLAKIASGGELSRVMLGIKSLLQTAEQPMTLVFDEIDAGIGGKTAHAVAERLARLAEQHQVIVITHLAQIAARADHHFLVSKASDTEMVHTTIRLLEGASREEEIARMLSGTLDAEALTHAKKLLEEARQ